MKNKILFLTFLAAGCLDLDSLENKRCPDIHTCAEDEECVDRKCVSKNQIKNDMTMKDGMDNDCFKSNYSTYTLNWYPNNLPLQKCTLSALMCKNSTPPKCEGNTVRELDCPSKGFKIYINDTDPLITYTSYVNTNGVTIYEVVRQNRDGLVRCINGTDIGCSTYPYVQYHCDTVN